LLGLVSEAPAATPMPVSSKTAASRPGASLLPFASSSFSSHSGSREIRSVRYGLILD